MTIFLSSSTLTALDRYHVAIRRARRFRRLAIGLAFMTPIGGWSLILAAFVISLVALAMGDAADALKPGTEARWVR